MSKRDHIFNVQNFMWTIFLYILSSSVSLCDTYRNYQGQLVVYYPGRI